jgi:hypothetical protein
LMTRANVQREVRYARNAVLALYGKFLFARFPCNQTNCAHSTSGSNRSSKATSPRPSIEHHNGQRREALPWRSRQDLQLAPGRTSSRNLASASHSRHASLAVGTHPRYQGAMPSRGFRRTRPCHAPSRPASLPQPTLRPTFLPEIPCSNRTGTNPTSFYSHSHSNCSPFLPFRPTCPHLPFLVRTLCPLCLLSFTLMSHSGSLGSTPPLFRPHKCPHPRLPSVSRLALPTLLRPALSGPHAPLKPAILRSFASLLPFLLCMPALPLLPLRLSRSPLACPSWFLHLALLSSTQIISWSSRLCTPTLLGSLTPLAPILSPVVLAPLFPVCLWREAADVRNFPLALRSPKYLTGCPPFCWRQNGCTSNELFCLWLATSSLHS